MPKYSAFAERLLKESAAREAARKGKQQLMMQLGVPLLMQKMEAKAERQQKLQELDIRYKNEAQQAADRRDFDWRIAQLEDVRARNIAALDAGVRTAIAELNAEIKRLKEGAPSAAQEDYGLMTGQEGYDLFDKIYGGYRPTEAEAKTAREGREFLDAVTAWQSADKAGKKLLLKRKFGEDVFKKYYREFSNIDDANPGETAENLKQKYADALGLTTNVAEAEATVGAWQALSVSRSNIVLQAEGLPEREAHEKIQKLGVEELNAYFNPQKSVAETINDYLRNK